jgi:hypothetical protein
MVRCLAHGGIKPFICSHKERPGEICSRNWGLSGNFHGQ